MRGPEGLNEFKNKAIDRLENARTANRASKVVLLGSIPSILIAGVTGAGPEISGPIMAAFLGSATVNTITTPGALREGK